MSQRRSSYNIEFVRVPRGAGGSASKVDLLKSALEINHKTSNTSVLTKERNSNQSLGRNRADSAPKLNHNNTKTLSIPNVPVLEVSNIVRSYHLLYISILFVGLKKNDIFQ